MIASASSSLKVIGKCQSISSAMLQNNLRKRFYEETLRFSQTAEYQTIIRTMKPLGSYEVIEYEEDDDEDEFSEDGDIIDTHARGLRQLKMWGRERMLSGHSSYSTPPIFIPRSRNSISILASVPPTPTPSGGAGEGGEGRTAPRSQHLSLLQEEYGLGSTFGKGSISSRDPPASKPVMDSKVSVRQTIFSSRIAHISSDKAREELKNEAKELVLNSRLAAYQKNISNRERWPTRWTFILACLGATVGITQIYAFPEYIKKFKDPVCFIPLIVCYYFVALPLLRLELCLGQISQGGFMKSISTLERRGRGVAVAAIIFCWILAWWISKDVAYNIFFLSRSFEGSELPWRVKTACGEINTAESCGNMRECFWADDEGKCKKDRIVSIAYFLQETVGFVNVNPFDGLGKFYWKKATIILFIWMLAFVFVFNGIVSLGYLVSLAMLLLAAISISVWTIFVFKSSSIRTLVSFFSKWNLSYLYKDWAIWSGALKISLQMVLCSTGAIHTIASYTPIGHNVIADSWWIVIGSGGASLLYGMIYWVGLSEVSISNTWKKWTWSDPSFESYVNIRLGWGKSFASNASVTPARLLYPQALTLLSSSVVASMMFFFAVSLTLLVSVVALAETIISSLIESRTFGRAKRPVLCFVVCLLFFLLGLILSYEVGTVYSDWLVTFIIQFGSFGIVFFECVVVGWLYGFKQQVESLGSKSSLLVYCSSWVLALTLCPIMWRIPGVEDIRYIITPATLLLLFIIVGMGILIAGCLCKSSLIWKTRLFWLLVGNTELLRQSFNGIIGSGISSTKRMHRFFSHGNLNFLWVISIKYIVPIFCYVTIITNVSTITKHAFDPERPPPLAIIPLWWFIVGVLLLAAIYFSLISSLFYPDWWKWLAPPDYCMWEISDAPHKRRRASLRTNIKSIRFFEGLKPVSHICPSSLWFQVKDHNSLCSLNVFSLPRTIGSNGSLFNS